jgi:hypothetical protein
MPAAEVLAEAVRGAEALLELAEDRLVVLDLLGLHVAEEVPDRAHALDGVLDVRLGVGDVRLEGLAQLLEHLRALVVVELLDVDVRATRPRGSPRRRSPSLRRGLEVRSRRACCSRSSSTRSSRSAA